MVVSSEIYSRRRSTGRVFPAMIGFDDDKGVQTSMLPAPVGMRHQCSRKCAVTNAAVGIVAAIVLFVVGVRAISVHSPQIEPYFAWSDEHPVTAIALASLGSDSSCADPRDLHRVSSGTVFQRQGLDAVQRQVVALREQYALEKD